MKNAHEVANKISFEGKRIKLYRQNCNRTRYFISTEPEKIYTTIREAFEAWDKVHDWRGSDKHKNKYKYKKKGRKNG